jgi:hypothetical protein
MIYESSLPSDAPENHLTVGIFVGTLRQSSAHSRVLHHTAVEEPVVRQNSIRS